MNLTNSEQQELEDLVEISVNIQAEDWTITQRISELIVKRYDPKFWSPQLEGENT